MVGDSQTLATDIDASRLPVYRFSTLDNTRVIHGVTTRTARLPLDGNMSFMVGDAPDLVQHNRSAWAAAIGYDPVRLVLGRQVHETAVVPVDDSHAGMGAESVETSIKRVDGLMTSTPNLPVGVMAADCVPILIHDPDRSVVAAVHAGWRGTVEGIAAESVSAMAAHYGSISESLRVCLGPSICAACYQVGTEVVDRWHSNPHSEGCDAVRQSEAGLHFDLREANRSLLVSCGVAPDSIEVSDICTSCTSGRMFSRRRLGPRTGLFTSVIMLAPDQ